MATRTQQRVGGPYCGPYGPSPVNHVAFLQSRHLQPERVPSRTTEKIASIRLVDVSRETMVDVQKLSENLKRMIAVGLNLKSVPEGLVSSLQHLSKLDLSDNQLGDNSFPESMKRLENLLELRLSNNSLTRIPGCLKKLKNLSRLDISDNKLELCVGLEKLRRLQSLVLDNNKLTSVIKDVAALKRLQVLRATGNSLKEIPRAVRQMKSLVDLDLSDNRISILPADVFQLPKLDVLSLGQNEITKVPTFNVRVQNQQWISQIDLSDNRLANFPGHLLLMTGNLDLGGNRIKTVSYFAVKKIDTESDKVLIMDDNPLIYPPLEVCESGLKNVLAFFQDSQQEVKVYQGLKLLVLGHYKSGKTSLVHSLIDQQPRMSEDVQDTSAGIDVFDMTLDLDELENGMPGKSLQLNITDFCGHQFYMFPNYVFFEQPSITVLTFSLPDYRSDKFEEQIGSWFDWMIAKTNKLVVILVGTQSDKLTRNQISNTTKEVRKKLSDHIEKQTEKIRERIRAIEEKPHISPTLSEQLKSYMKLLKAKFTVQTDVIVTSSKSFAGMDRLKQAIETLSEDRDLFPNVMREIPTFWLEVETFIEDRGNSLPIPVMTWDSFVEEVTSRFGMKHLIKSIAQYLHDTGKVLWFSEVASLKELVFVRPSWLFDVFRSFLSHDVDNTAVVSDDILRTVGLISSKFDRLKQDLINDGILDKDLLRCLLPPLVPTDSIKPVMEVMSLLTESFQLGYSVQKQKKNSIFSLTADKDNEGITKLNKILLPWLRNDPEPEEFIEKWRQLENNRVLAVCFRFPIYLPSGLFEILSVRAHDDSHKLKFLHQWKGGFHARHNDEKVRVLVLHSIEPDSTVLNFDSINDSDRDDGCCTNDFCASVKFEIRDDSDHEGDQTPAAAMWTILLPLLMELETLLNRFSGVLVERLAQCPLCKKFSFLGEWLTPKETQILPTRKCENCLEDVDTAFLVQPRERKRDDILRDVMRKARRRRGATTANQLSDNISKMAPSNPRRARVANPELDVENSLQLLEDPKRSRSSSAVSQPNPNDKQGILPDDFNIEQIQVYQEIRKFSNFSHVDLDTDENFDDSTNVKLRSKSNEFFVTHNANEIDVESDVESFDEKCQFPGLAEFQLKFGIVPSFVVDDDEDDKEDEDLNN